MSANGRALLEMHHKLRRMRLTAVARCSDKGVLTSQAKPLGTFLNNVRGRVDSQRTANRHMPDGGPPTAGAVKRLAWSLRES